jgi:hypothetical protein
VSAAKAAVQQTQLDADNAMSRLADVQAGAPAERVSAARNEVATARAALDSALARVADLNSRPSRAELADAQDRIAAADAAVRHARDQANLPVSETDPAAFDELLLEKTAVEERAQLEMLEADLAATSAGRSRRSGQSRCYTSVDWTTSADSDRRANRRAVGRLCDRG